MTTRVLIADDQALVRDGFRMILEAEEGFEVVGEAADGLEAVLAARETTPDVILMDVRMPNVDGLEATRKLLERDDTGARVLILTTFDLDEYVYEALRAGASGFLLKDTPPEQLVEAIRVVAQGDELLAPSVTCRIVAEFARSARGPDRAVTGPRRARAGRARAAATGRLGPFERGDRGRERRGGSERQGRTSAGFSRPSSSATGCTPSSSRTSEGCSPRRSARTTEVPRFSSTARTRRGRYKGTMDVAATLTSRLIGTLFVERGLVSESQIRVALEIQRETGEQLGRILVERFGVSRQELASVVAEQWEELGQAGTPEAEARSNDSWQRLGEIFVQRGFVTPEQLDQALQRQRETGERVGEALVAQGAISKFELAGALAEQMAALEGGSAEAPPVQEATVHPLTPRVEEAPEPEAEVEAEPELEASRSRNPRSRSRRPRASRCSSQPRPPRSRRSAAWRSRRRPPATGSSSWAARRPTSVRRSTSRTSASSSFSASADHPFPTTSGPACSSSRASATTSGNPRSSADPVLSTRRWAVLGSNQRPWD